MAGKQAPRDGLIRNDKTKLARRVRAGALIPNGWSFDDGGAAKKPAKKPAENQKGAGPSETS